MTSSITSANNLIIVITVIFVIAAIAILRAIEYFIISSKYKLFYHLTAVAVLINIFILVFLVYTFEPVIIVKGPAGPKGNRGKVGYTGASDTCGMCSIQTTSLGYHRNEKAKRETIIIENPILNTSTY
jgi:hypothetical protein